VSTDLPPGLAAAWGAPGPTKGPRPKLTLGAIVAAGIALADAEGLDAASMNRIAKELGSSPMGLYRYVASKDELLALMVDAALGATPAAQPSETWRDGLRRCARAQAGAMGAHPWSTDVPVSGPPVTPNAVAWFEQALHAMADTDLHEAEKAGVVLLLSGYVSNHVQLMRQVRSRFLDAAADPHAAMRGWTDTIRGLTDRATHPALHAALDAGVFDRADPPEDEFAFGLERILDGVKALVHRRARSAGS
jgi:AcrR family transcriptional regulator